MVLFYKTDQYEGELISSDEGEVYWLELEGMKKIRLAEGMDKMLEVFFDDSVSEYFFYKENGEWTGILKQRNFSVYQTKEVNMRKDILK